MRERQPGRRVQGHWLQSAVKARVKEGEELRRHDRLIAPQMG
jgi:hypothetical protein